MGWSRDPSATAPLATGRASRDNRPRATPAARGDRGAALPSPLPEARTRPAPFLQPPQHLLGAQPHTPTGARPVQGPAGPDSLTVAQRRKRGKREFRETTGRCPAHLVTLTKMARPLPTEPVPRPFYSFPQPLSPCDHRPNTSPSHRLSVSPDGM